VTAYSELELDQVMKEYECIVSLHTPSPSFGIISPPTMFKEELRCTMVYKMHHCDLFNFLNEYCNLTGKRGVPEGTARLWIAQLLVAVKAMVGKGVAHRDLKPENILLDHHGNVVLTDFELATSVGKAGKEEEDGVPPQVVGTPLYIPPEVGSKRFCDIKKNDIWSLGVIAWEMVHDSNPWKLNVDRMPPYEVLLRTNRTTTLGNHAMERGMSDEYFDFVRGCVREHDKRFTVEEAMKHKIFEGIDFGDMGALFKQDGVHELLGEVWGVFKDIQ
jgi:serine/threonine protein kinase